MANKVKTELRIEQEGERFFSVLTKEYDYAPNYHTVATNRMEIISRDWCVKNLEDLKQENDKVIMKLADNDKFLAKMNPEDFEDDEFKQFMEDFEDKYKGLIAKKEKYEEYKAKEEMNNNFKLESKEQQKFIEHYAEMLEKWK